LEAVIVKPWEANPVNPLDWASYRAIGDSEQRLAASCNRFALPRHHEFW